MRRLVARRLLGGGSGLVLRHFRHRALQLSHLLLQQINLVPLPRHHPVECIDFLLLMREGFFDLGEFFVGHGGDPFYFGSRYIMQ